MAFSLMRLVATFFQRAPQTAPDLIGGSAASGDVAPMPPEKPVVRFDPATGLMVEKFLHYGHLHRGGDKPAVIEYDPTTKRIVREQYFQRGVLHREGSKPAYIEYAPSTGHVTLEVFFRKGRLYHDDKTPGAINYDSVTGERVIYDPNRPGAPPVKRDT